MKKYSCPMHPEIEQKKPGRCPKCGMALVPQDKITEHSMSHHSDKTTWKSYIPLLVIIDLILLVAITISISDVMQMDFNISKTISYFMIGFFLVFSGFKLIDLPGFAQGYFTYDLLAKRFFVYGYIYPFIELFFGLAMILYPTSTALLWTEVLIMTFSGIGVAIKLAKKEQFQCACLGTFLKVPLTKVTLIEDFGMAFLALAMILATS
jgi:hypothetical protein